jgi:hypothetical protein
MWLDWTTEVEDSLRRHIHVNDLLEVLHFPTPVYDFFVFFLHSSSYLTTTDNFLTSAPAPYPKCIIEGEMALVSLVFVCDV